MNGPDHYRAAEQLLNAVTNAAGAIVVETGTAEVLAAAQVHAELAHTAAFADAVITDTNYNASTNDIAAAWARVFSHPQPDREPAA